MLPGPGEDAEPLARQEPGNACGAFGALTVDADGARWRSSCGCYGVRPLGEPAAVALFHASAGHAS